MVLKVASMGLGTRSDLLMFAMVLPHSFGVNVHDQPCDDQADRHSYGQQCGAMIG
jgi:hypothetical protein